MDFAVFVAIGYLLGSVPFGVIAGRLFTGEDVRRHGSGNIGTANVLRTVGARAAVLVLALDMGKAILAVVLAKVVTGSPGVQAAAAVAAVLGHSWPVFIGFRGGRGAATGLGALYVLSPISAVITTVVAASVMAITRYASLGSVLGASAGAVVLIVLSITGIEPLAYVWFAIFGVSFVVARHGENIRRLVKGQERKIGRPAEKVASDPKADGGKGSRWPKSA